AEAATGVLGGTQFSACPLYHPRSSRCRFGHPREAAVCAGNVPDSNGIGDDCKRQNRSYQTEPVACEIFLQAVSDNPHFRPFFVAKSKTKTISPIRKFARIPLVGWQGITAKPANNYDKAQKRGDHTPIGATRGLGVRHIFLRAPLSSDAMAFFLSRGEQRLRDAKLATSSYIMWSRTRGDGRAGPWRSQAVTFTLEAVGGPAQPRAADGLARPPALGGPARPRAEPRAWSERPLCSSYGSIASRCATDTAWAPA